ncbi:MAG TPA: DNA polymerase I [Petrotogaceae bacterium]|jgi:DNA polymerase-1|nr:DNA polymerase I [Petrotogaceae bacterium]HPA92832.1 DNA polymerase I [Petrotogaceae bacterium]HQO11765.1 DNA polymerase I [Petrotogaceae bacterium]HQP57638.1 DNA polymerase I [Petrotogaceae bacterium]
MKDLYLIDGSGIAYRAFFAVDQNLTAPSGLHTNAIFGVCRMMLKIIKDYIKKDEDGILFVFDKKTKTYRHELLESYKAQRPKAPAEFVEQLEYIVRLVELLGINVACVDNYEADDVIATIAQRYKEQVENVYIITSDKDMMQLVKDNIFILRPEKGIGEVVKFDEEKIFQKMGVPPSKITELLALMGDASDNVPGVKGIGEKTAQKLLQNYKDLDDLYQRIDELSASTKEKLLSDRDMAFLSRKLVQLSKDVPLYYKDGELLYSHFDEKLKDFLQELGFKSMIREVGDTPRKSSDSECKGVCEEYTLDRSREFFARAGNTHELSVSVSAWPKDPFKGVLKGAALSWKDNGDTYTSYMDLSGAGEGEAEDFLKQLSVLFEDKVIIGYNLKFLLSVFLLHGLKEFKVGFDTMTGAFLLMPDEKRFDLDSICQKYLGMKMPQVQEPSRSTLFDGQGQSGEDETLKKACLAESLYNLLLFDELSKLIKEKELESAAYDIDFPVTNVLAFMETKGVYFDTQYLKTLEHEFTAKINDIDLQIRKYSDQAFNPNSPKQVGELLFGKLGLKGTKKTKTGSFSTDAETLEEISDQHPVISLILGNRKYQKLLSTYINAIPALVNPITGRVHTSLNITGAATGRLSSTEPNLQNLPIREEEGEKIRGAVKAQKEDSVIISADYSQIELRVLAHMSGDEVLIDAYHHDKDIHALTASKIFGIDLEQVTSAERRVGKTVNFSIVYGVTAFGLANRTGISNLQAQRFIDKYFDLYRGVDLYQRNILNFLRINGYVQTIFGRKRFLRNMPFNKGEIERMAINSPVQGSAADIMKLAMIKLYKTLPQYAQMILQVHDEILIEVPQKMAEQVVPIICNAMENAVELKVPLKVDVNISKNWKK